MLLESDFGFVYRPFFDIFFFFSFASLDSIVEDAYQDDSDQVNRSEPEKFCLSSQYSYNQWLQYEKIDTKQKKEVFFHRAV